MSNDTNKMIGKLLDATAQRDAIHIAVAPVIATHALKPGQSIMLAKNDPTRATSIDFDKQSIGIVDPFLLRDVIAGERFFMFLVPNTITSLRHDWTHPAFKDVVVDRSTSARDPEGASKRWIEEYAPSIDQDYESLIAAAHKHIGGGWEMDNSEAYKNASDEDWKTFWKHYEIVTGEKVADDERYAPFSCSC